MSLQLAAAKMPATDLHGNLISERSRSPAADRTGFSAIKALR